MARTADPEKAAAWKKIHRRFNSSGLSQREFCQQEGLSLSTFCYWLKKLGGQQKPEARFIPLDFVKERSSTGPDLGSVNLVVELPGGIVLRFSGLPR